MSDDIEIIESLDHGDIIFWQKIRNDMELSELIKKHLKQKNGKVLLEADKYVQMMTVNRCIEPLSKLGTARWIERTSYKEMKDMKNLSLDANYFYRSMDHLLSIKDELESSIFERLKDLFSVNVKMTFYDITSTYIYSENCPIGAHGYSRDNLPAREQIIVGVVTSYEGYPIKHYVFAGNTKDETTVREVVSQLKEQYDIEETTFVGDRGMITKLNIETLISQGYDYIMGVKAGQDEIAEMILSEEEKWEDSEEYGNLKMFETRIKVNEFILWKIKMILKNNGMDSEEKKYDASMNTIRSFTNVREMDYKSCKKMLREISEAAEPKVFRKIYEVIKRYEKRYEDELRYVVCLNSERKILLKNKRDEYINKISGDLDKVFSGKVAENNNFELEKSINKLFEGYKGKYRKIFEIRREGIDRRAVGYEINRRESEAMEKRDGVFILQTSRFDIDKLTVVKSYKNLQEVEILFDDFKNFVDVRPIRHWLEVRVRSHVFICILALLLKRIFEINYLKGKQITEVTEELSKSKLVKYKVKFSPKEDRNKTFSKVTNTTPLQKKYFGMVGIKNPENLEKFVW